ncbi:hypothetical protein [Miniphocaeibacter massiliensis]|uniref:hypothetical protein n=1 Tax=Miniphocaeibacter massiliensis TaxID=2041841 RepID=UPI000C1BD624|nr:hypothetical protein [Miniphocaeibacter massiliensis]
MEVKNIKKGAMAIVFLMIMCIAIMPDSVIGKYIFHPMGISSPKEKISQMFSNRGAKIGKIGETLKFDDGLEVTVSDLEEVELPEGVEDKAPNWKKIKFSSKVINKGDKKLDLFFWESPTVFSDGKVGCYISSEIIVGDDFTMDELEPNATSERVIIWAVKNPKDIKIEYNDMNKMDKDSGAGKEHQGAIFTSY